MWVLWNVDFRLVLIDFFMNFCRQQYTDVDISHYICEYELANFVCVCVFLLWKWK